MDSKACTKCGAVKPLGEFSKDKRKKDGVQVYCKKCSCEIAREYRKNNPEKRSESRKKYEEKNKEKIKQAGKKYRQKHPEKRREIARNHYRKNPEKSRQRYALWGEKNRASIRKRNKEYTDGFAIAYVKKLLVKQGFTTDQITPELTELKIEQIKMVRLSRQLKKAAKENNVQPN